MEEEQVDRIRKISPLAMHLSMAGALLQGTKNAQYDMEQMVKGMQRYQTSDYIAKKCNYDVVWSLGEASLRRIQVGHVQKNDILILVPSLVNKSDIFDLCEERSMAQWFCDQGFDVFIFDWGNLSNEPEIKIETLIADRLCSAIQKLHEQYSTKKIHALGYCMGGVLCLGAVYLTPQCLDTLTLIATPWDFHRGFQTLLNRIRFWAPLALMQAERSKILCSSSLQTLFASVDPLLTQKKFSKFVEMEEGSKNYKIFVAVEDWLNDGVDIPHNVAFETIENWYLKNALVKNEWHIANQKVDFKTLNIPVSVVASRKDSLVEYESAISLQKEIKHAEVLEVSCGHIGMMAGRNSIEEIWEPISEWIRNAK